MIENSIEKSSGDVWYVYDGECPLCRTAAHALRIREAVGRLHLVNAREESDHPVIAEINARGLDLDQGTVIKFGDTFYHGGDTMTVMALLGTRQGWFNRMNAMLFRSEAFARFCYPAIRAGRNMLLWCKGTGQIRNLEAAKVHPPIFQDIFGEEWRQLPPVMHKHYANRPYSSDIVTVEGMMKIELSPFMRLLSPVLKLTGHSAILTTNTAATTAGTAATTSNTASQATNLVGNTVQTTANTAAVSANTAAVSSESATSGGGGLFSTVMSFLPAFDVGSSNVPRDMVAQIHQGEIIVPAAQASGIRSGQSMLGLGGSRSMALPDAAAENMKFANSNEPPGSMGGNTYNSRAGDVNLHYSPSINANSNVNLETVLAQQGSAMRRWLSNQARNGSLKTQH